MLKHPLPFSLYHGNQETCRIPSFHAHAYGRLTSPPYQELPSPAPTTRSWGPQSCSRRLRRLTAALARKHFPKIEEDKRVGSRTSPRHPIGGWGNCGKVRYACCRCLLQGSETRVVSVRDSEAAVLSAIHRMSRNVEFWLRKAHSRTCGSLRLGGAH